MWSLSFNYLVQAAVKSFDEVGVLGSPSFTLSRAFPNSIAKGGCATK